MDLISFLVPTLNVGKHITKCLDSIINQLYKNFEIIIVDGGSKDETLSIINEYKSVYKNIYLYSCEKFGISHTRNKLLEKANGDYIVFVDGDDYIEKDMILNMMDFMKRNDCDIVSCGYTMDYPLFRFRRKICQTGVMTSKEAIQSLVSNSGFNNYLWGKIYKRKCFEGIRFPDSFSSFEDAAIMFLVLSKTNRIGNLNVRYYHYVQRDGSLTSHMDLKTTYDMRNTYRYQEKLLSQMYPQDAFDFTTHYYNMDLYIMYTLLIRCKKGEISCFERSDLDFRKIGKSKLLFYDLILKMVKVKFGKDFLIK